MVEIVLLWVALGFFSFGILGLHLVLMRRAAAKPWRLRVNKDYMPKVSILVPTYNEANVIRFKLENLIRIDYPKDLTQIIVVDSNSSDNTVSLVNEFAERNSVANILLLIEKQRRGKASALNFALSHCDGDVVIVSDADCFWPPDVLHMSLPFLADPGVGAISGPKLLLNSHQSWVTRTEETYLNSMNLLKLGESKIGSTLLFEGGFSAYKREVLESFDPYNTGSDDCGTVVKLVERKSRAIFVPEARFYTTFPATWREKMSMKVRRSNQLVRVLWRYVCLLFKGRIEGSKRVVVQGVFTYIVGPLVFIAFIAATIVLLLSVPYLALAFSVFLIPKVGFYLLESLQNYFVLFFSIVAAAFNRRFLVWKQPADRVLLNEEMLRTRGLI